MKKLSVLTLFLFLILGLRAQVDSPNLFEIDKELDSFKKTEITEEERKKY